MSFHLSLPILHVIDLGCRGESSWRVMVAAQYRSGDLARFDPGTRKPQRILPGLSGRGNKSWHKGLGKETRAGRGPELEKRDPEQGT